MAQDKNINDEVRKLDGELIGELVSECVMERMKEQFGEVRE